VKKFLVILILAGGLLYWQRHREASPAPSTAPPAPVRQIAASAPATSPQPSQPQHWPKRAIDRARDVAGQARQNSTGAQQP
jgi:hypothetical protein